MMMNRQSKILVLVLVVLAGLVFSTARADDTLNLEDGRTLHGQIVRELEGYIWFRYEVGGIERTQMFKPGEIAEVVRDAEPSDPVKKAEDGSDQVPVDIVGGAPRAAVITLGEGGSKDMVGIYITAHILKQLIPLLEAEHIDIVVFRVNSGGGMLLEIQRLSDVIQNEYKPRFRVVAWIESAISAAAMTSHCIEEIYLMPQGSYGACTGWSGALVAVKGRELEEVLYMMEKISARGNHDPKIMRSMQIMKPLSFDVDPETGDLTWYNSLDGEHIVNPEGRILTFNARTAEEAHFSAGTAATVEELGRLMGYEEVEWVGEKVPGVEYPVCQAERVNREFRAKTYENQKRTNEYLVIYRQAISMAQSTPREDRGKFVGRARQYLNRIKSMVKTTPNFALLTFNMTDMDQFKEWVERQEKLLRDLMK